MKTEQVPGEKPRSPQPEAAHIARVAHNLILSVLVATQVSFSSSPPTTRVAIIRGLHITASTGFEGAPSHNIPHPASIPSPHFAAASAILCDDPPFGLTSTRHCAAGRHFQSGGSGGRVTRSSEVPSGAGDEGSRCRAKIHLLGHAFFESLVNLALLRRRADQGLWAQCYRLRLRLRMRCTVLCASL